MLHACVERFDVTGTVGKILGTKRGLIGRFVFNSITPAGITSFDLPVAIVLRKPKTK